MMVTMCGDCGSGGECPIIGCMDTEAINYNHEADFSDESCMYEFLLGDTNFDGIVDILDIVRIVNQIMGNLEFNDDEFTAADFNADGIVDILDIVQIVNYILDN